VPTSKLGGASSAVVVEHAEARVGGCSGATKASEERLGGWGDGGFCFCSVCCGAVGAGALGGERLAAPEGERSPYGCVLVTRAGGGGRAFTLH
jgi:hypothetical protein